MMKLKHLFMLKMFLKNSVVILKILIQKQVFSLNFQMLVLYMIRTHIGHPHILVPWILMSKISTKMIIKHRIQSIRQLMNPILGRLNYLLNNLSITIKIIQMIHRTFHMKPKRRLKLPL